jgi:hypothetical protein
MMRATGLNKACSWLASGSAAKGVAVPVAVSHLGGPCIRLLEAAPLDLRVKLLVLWVDTC